MGSPYLLIGPKKTAHSPSRSSLSFQIEAQPEEKKLSLSRSPERSPLCLSRNCRPHPHRRPLPPRRRPALSPSPPPAQAAPSVHTKHPTQPSPREPSLSPATPRCSHQRRPIPASPDGYGRRAAQRGHRVPFQGPCLRPDPPHAASSARAQPLPAARVSGTASPTLPARLRCPAPPAASFIPSCGGCARHPHGIGI